ncbi:hypothetical protein SF2457T_0109 [Shigella flexneri 2a str. 2457T]|nr:hypothetical protein SF2457T_0109 [Shigella flexneri 2a str. 2457T]
MWGWLHANCAASRCTEDLSALMQHGIRMLAGTLRFLKIFSHSGA